MFKNSCLLGSHFVIWSTRTPPLLRHQFLVNVDMDTMLDEAYQTVVTESVHQFHLVDRDVSNLSSLEPVVWDPSALAQKFEGCVENLNRCEAFLLKIGNWDPEKELVKFRSSS